MTESPARVAIGLGSNLQDPVTQLRSAFAALAELPRTRLLRRSRLYRSAPMGPPGQPDYVNAAALLETELAPLELLDALQAIEHAQGRVRAERWGARTLDLDLLLWDETQIALERLSVPHPGLHERAFVLYPLAELDPHWVVPGQGRVGELQAACPAQGLALIEGDPQ